VVVEHQLLIITEAAARDRDGESVRVALDVLRGSSQAKAITPDSPRELGQALERRGGRRPVVVGGDRTLHEVVEALHQRRELAQTPVGWVPLGARSQLAGSVGLPLDPAGAARVVLNGADRWLDLIVDDADGVAVASVRVGSRRAGPGSRAGQAETARSGPEGEPGGTPWPARAADLLHRLGGGFGWRLRVEADGKVVADLDDRIALVGFGNAEGLLGGGTPGEAFSGDGYADLVVTHASSPFARLGRARPPQPERTAGGSSAGASSAAEEGDAAAGEAPGGATTRAPSGVRDGEHLVQAHTLTVRGRDFPYLADGVSCGPVRSRTWTVRQAAWRLTVPPPG
jgi:diacylglycerol kinase (ATP)